MPKGKKGQKSKTTYCHVCVCANCGMGIATKDTFNNRGRKKNLWLRLHKRVCPGVLFNPEADASTQLEAADQIARTMLNNYDAQEAGKKSSKSESKIHNY